MASNTTKDATLELHFKTDGAKRDLQELGNEARKTQSEIAKDITKRYGQSELDRPEPSKAQIRYSKAAASRERRWEEDRWFKQEAERERGSARQPSKAGNPLADIVNTIKAAGVIAMITHELAADARILGINANSNLTNAQKNRAGVESIPIIGSWIRSGREIIEALDGTTDAMIQLRAQMGRDDHVRSGHWQNESMRIAFASQANAAQRQYLSIRGSRVPEIGEAGRFRGPDGSADFSVLRGHDRSTVLGERGYQEELQRLPGIDASLEAQRQAAAARATLGGERGQLSRIEKEREEARHRQERARARHAAIVESENRTGKRSQVRQQAALVEWNAANIDVAALDAQRLQQIERVRDAAVSAAQAEGQARQRNIDLMRTELSIQENRTNRLISAAQTFGAMNPLEQALAANALRAVRDRGVRGVTPEVLARARALNPEFVGMAQRNRAETEPLFQDLRNEGLLGEGTNGSIAQNQAITEEMRQSIREQTLASQERLASEVSDALGSTFERILTTFRDRLTALENQFTQGLQNQFNAQ